MNSQKIIISACLLGDDVKYDGTNNSIHNDPLIQKLIELDMLIKICPEVEGGLPIPRPKSEIIGNKVQNIQKIDVTQQFLLGAKKICEIAQKNSVKIAILKSKSPSCGKDFVYDGGFSKVLVNGDGMSVRALKKMGVKIFDENELKKVEKILFK